MKRFALTLIALLVFCISCDPVLAEERIDSYEFQANGNLRFGYVIFGPAPDSFQSHAVRFSDRSPKLCGDPDGTGRYVWFFTDAQAIERKPQIVASRKAFQQAFNPFYFMQGETRRDP